MPGREQQLAHTRHRPEDRQAIGARRPQADPDLVQARVPEPGCHPQRLGQHLPDALGRGLRAKAGAGLAGRADHDPATRPRHDVVAATPGYDRPRPGLGPGQPQVAIWPRWGATGSLMPSAAPSAWDQAPAAITSWPQAIVPVASATP